MNGIAPFSAPPVRQSLERRATAKRAGVKRLLPAVLAALTFLSQSARVLTAQDTTRALTTTPTTAKPDVSVAPQKVDMNPVARDEEIRLRLQKGVPVTMVDGKTADAEQPAAQSKRPPALHPEEPADAETAAEGGLSSEAGVLQAQAKQTQPLEREENLLSK